MPSPTVDISEMCFVPVRPNERGLVGFVSFVIDQKLFIGNVAVLTKLDGSGVRLLYPNRNVNGKQVNCVFPISKGVGFAITKAAQKKYEKFMNSLTYSVLHHETVTSEISAP